MPSLDFGAAPNETLLKLAACNDRNPAARQDYAQELRRIRACDRP